jgi:hypothetical protein
MGDALDQAVEIVGAEVRALKEATVEVAREERISRRDFFAAKAMPSLMILVDRADLHDVVSRGEKPEQLIARRAYAYADAMIAASKEPRHG